MAEEGRGRASWELGGPLAGRVPRGKGFTKTQGKQSSAVVNQGAETDTRRTPRGAGAPPSTRKPRSTPMDGVAGEGEDGPDTTILSLLGLPIASSRYIPSTDSTTAFQESSLASRMRAPGPVFHQTLLLVFRCIGLLHSKLLIQPSQLLKHLELLLRGRISL